MQYERLKNIKIACKGTVAKTNPEDSNQFLPLWMHLTDTGLLMKKLVESWIPESTKEMLFKDFKDSNHLQRVSTLLGMIHDIGKSSAIFQSKISQYIPDYQGCLLPYEKYADYKSQHNKSHHALISEAILLRKENDCSWPEWICSIAGAHHGKVQDSYTVTTLETTIGYQMAGKNIKKRLEWHKSWAELKEAILKFTEYDINEFKKVSKSSQMVLCGLLIAADWLASNPYYFPLIDISDSGDINQYPERIEKAWKKIGFTRPWKSKSECFSNEAFEQEFSFSPNEMQKAVIKALREAENPGLLIIEAEMGTGKTEAALAAAEILQQKVKSGGIFYGLPTQATANGLLPRFKEYVEKQSLNQVHSFRLLHGLANYNENFQSILRGKAQIDDPAESEESTLIVHDWMEGRKQALFSDFVIGTIDQAIMAALEQKHVMLRHTALAGKILIFDEIHSFDAYTQEYIARTLEWMGSYDVPVILLSATLPSKIKENLLTSYLKGKAGKKTKTPFEPIQNAYPLLTWTDDLEIKQCVSQTEKISKTIQIEKIKDPKDFNAIKDILNTSLVHGGCAAVICNTIKKAQDFYLFLLSHKVFKKDEICLFHSRFSNNDRILIENYILQKLGKKSGDSGSKIRERFVVVASPVLEQSLDIDVDLLISELAPGDLMLQRMGRLHRHNRKRPAALTKPKCIVFGTDKILDSGSEAIYGKWLLHQTARHLLKEIVFPKDIPGFIEDVYSENDTESDEFQEFEEIRRKKSSKAKTYLLPSPSTKVIDTLNDFISKIIEGTANGIESGVRDGTFSKEAFLLIENLNGTFSPVGYPECELNLDKPLDSEKILILQKARIRLPQGISENKEFKELMERNWQKKFSAWKKQPGLIGTYFLTLDSNHILILESLNIQYSKELGLTYKQECKNNDTTKI